MSDSEFIDKRRFHRIFYKANATLASEAETWPCEIKDLSLNGCLLFLPDWQGDTDKIYVLKLDLTEDIRITMNLSLSHLNSDHAGFRCVHIDFDSISELRRLVELNLGDNDLLERDLQALSA